MAGETTASAAEQPQPQQFSEEVLKTFESKSYSKFYDPCQEAANKSIKCMHRNPGNKDLCNDYFQAYRDCKKAWLEAQRAHRMS